MSTLATQGRNCSTGRFINKHSHVGLASHTTKAKDPALELTHSARDILEALKQSNGIGKASQEETVGAQGNSDRGV
jgi:hypothetical protein